MEAIGFSKNKFNKRALRTKIVRLSEYDGDEIPNKIRNQWVRRLSKSLELVVLLDQQY